MASSTQTTIKQEPFLTKPSTSNQSATTADFKEELKATTKPEDETFEQFYSEVIRFSIKYHKMLLFHSYRLKRLKNVMLF